MMSDVDPVVDSKDWRAWEDRQPPDPASLHVTGTVVTSTTNYTVKLEKVVPQGINPRILLLELVVEKSGDIGGQAITPHDVRYDEHKDDGFTVDKYDKITIHRSEGGGAEIEEIEIVS